MKRLIIIIILSLLTVLACTKTSYGNTSETYTVKRVIDGDTLELDNGEIVELIGIDCPEADVKMGKEATEFVKGFIGGSEVRLEFDVEKRDKYGRLLAYVYKRRDVTGWRYKMWYKEGVSYTVHEEEKTYTEIFVNAYIITKGYASPMTIPPNVKHAELFKKLYQEARENKRGLWR